jgi:hypothetical protein
MRRPGIEASLKANRLALEDMWKEKVAIRGEKSLGDQRDRP